MYTEKQLNLKKKTELVEICKKRNIEHKNLLKAQLIKAIMGAQTYVEPKCFKRIEPRYILARKNQYGNYEDPNTSLVFHPQTKEVLGRQEKDEIKKLSIADVEFCRVHGLQFSQAIFDGNFSSTTEKDIETVIQELEKQAEESSFDSDDEDNDDENDA
jgi:hypothetical protein